MNNAIILAAGKGTRMKSSMPKCMHKLIDKPMISYITDATANLEQHVVVGYKEDVIKDYLKDSVKYHSQKEQLGTAHAVMQVKNLEGKSGITVIINGDLPLITKDTIDSLVSNHKSQSNALTLLTTKVENPFGYGRIVKDTKGNVLKIVEEKDCDENQKNIKEINIGVYCFDNEKLFEYLKRINNNNKQNEFYLTDLIELFVNDNLKIQSQIIKDNDEAYGINDKYQLSVAEEILSKRINKMHQLNGVIISQSNTVTIGPNVKIQEGTKIFPNTHITGDVTIGNECNIGPFARIRGKCGIGSNVKIGNFVEVKKSVIGDNTSLSHHIYCGDAIVGKNVNLGCGVVTVNYDGVKKHKTTIGDNAFVGCNVNLIAPVNIGNNCLVAAGTTVTKDIESGALSIGRTKQIDKPNLAKRYLGGK